MTRLFVIVLLAVMSSGIAQAEERVSTKELGMVSENTNRVFEILKARRARALAGAVKSIQPTQQPVMVAKTTQPENVVVSVEKSSQETFPTATAPVSQVVSNYTANPVKVEKKEHTFDEYTLYAGGWYAMNAHSKGLWTLGEWTHWWAGKEEPQNFGLGITAKADKGWGQNGSHWGYFAPGLNLDYYNAFTDEDDVLAKFRPMYRFGENKSGFMPGGYLQYSHTLGRKDKIIASADGQYFRNDSYLGLALMWEHRFNRNLKVRGGPFAGINFMQNETVVGIGPEIVFDLYDRFEIGLSANFAKRGPFLGAFVGYKVNTDLRMVDSNLRERSVKMEEKGSLPTAVAGEVTVTQTASGNYSTMPTADMVTVSEKTLDEQ